MECLGEVDHYLITCHACRIAANVYGATAITFCILGSVSNASVFYPSLTAFLKIVMRCLLGLTVVCCRVLILSSTHTYAFVSPALDRVGIGHSALPLGVYNCHYSKINWELFHLVNPLFDLCREINKIGMWALWISPILI